jgi:hypothetical protein
MPIRRAVAATRQAISPRLAMRILLNMVACFLVKLDLGLPQTGGYCVECAPFLLLAKAL